MVEVATSTSGLTGAEVEERRRAGRTNQTPRSASPPVSRILRRNLLSPINLVLGAAVAAVFAVGEGLDAIFAIPLVLNLAIGIALELRAKSRLDRLTLLTTPKVAVRRDGEEKAVTVDEVVQDDVCVLRPGDQVVADGTVLESGGLEIDESSLTGESDAVVKATGDTVSSGSFVVAGEGAFRAERVGRDSTAARLTAEAQAGPERLSPLQREIVSLLQTMGKVAVPILVAYLLVQYFHDLGLKETVRNTVTASVALIPEGLLLLTSARFALGAMRLASQGIVVSRLDAVESLARVDVLCLDKTGTITKNMLRVTSVEAFDEGETGDVERALGRLAASMPGANRTVGALAAAFPADAETPLHHVPFASSRRWSGLVLEGLDGPEGWVIGAPESFPRADSMWEKAEPHTRAGRRVILAGRADAALLSLAGPDGGPPPIVPLGIVILDDDVRDGAATTLAYFADQGVTLKLISGDNPDTVRAVAAKAGLEIVDWTSGPDLPDSDLGATVEQFQVFGRITPQQKRSLVEALRANNHHVAMTGDGVNDVLALRAADLGIALQEGTAAAQAVSSLVMLADAFPALPETVKEGRRIVHGIATVARLFLLKTFYSALITAAVVVVAVITSKSPDYPFHPRQLSMMSTYSIGIPAFWLTIANRQPDKPPLRFIAEVLRVAIPGAIVAAATALATFYGLRDIAHSDLAQVRTATALSVCVVAMTFIPCAEFAQPEGRQRRIRLAAFLAVVYSAAFPIIFALPFARKIYDVVPLTMGQWTVCLSVGVAGALLLVAVMAMVRRRWAVS